MRSSRREFLVFMGIAPATLIAAKSPKPENNTARNALAKPADTACYDPATLPLSQKNSRRAIGFMEISDNPKKSCGQCAFFTAGQGACGSCQLLTGGRVTSAGLCTSFAAKSG
jgi:hypothetical protein